MTELALEMDGYSLRLQGREILRKLSFAVPRGERIALIGPNGAGKTTLLRSFCRLVGGGQGAIRIAGRPLEGYRQADLARRLAYVPQVEGRSAPYTVRELVEMSRYPHLGPLAPIRAIDRAAVDRALLDTGLVSLSERALSTLSGGERQKAMLAAALAQESEILLLDEPSAFLDPAQKAEFQKLLGRVHRERAATILFVTHDLNEALAHSERILALREGSLAFDGPAAALPKGDALRRIYDHDFAIGAHPRLGSPVLFVD
jgi:iron complex transport system ATP-binding protein